MATVNVNAGICGFNTEIKTESEDGDNVKIEFKTECPHLKPMEEELKELNGFTEYFSKMDESEVYKVAKKYCIHIACPVPSGILKAVEVACGLALPRDAVIKVSKD